MTETHNLACDWYGDFAPILQHTTVCVRQSPPFNSILSCGGCTTIKSETFAWKQPRILTGDDFLDWLEKTVLLNADRIALEFLFESEVKNSRLLNASGVHVTDPVSGVSVELERDMLFKKTGVTYHSWSLLYQLIDAVNTWKIKAPVFYQGVIPSALAYVIAVFVAYDSKVDTTVSSLVLYKKLAQSQRVCDLLVKALYGFNVETGMYSVRSDGPVGIAFPRVDMNFIATFKKKWINSRMMKACVEFGLGSVCSITDDIWAVATPPMFKAHRDTLTYTRGKYKVGNPVSVRESAFRQVVSGMIDVVFDGVAVWDTIQIPYTLGVNGREFETTRLRFYTALCLLQLGIGSRSRGIIGVNKIEQLDTPVLSGVQFLRSLDQRELLGVTNLTKSQPEDRLAHKMHKKMSKIDGDFDMSDAVQVVDDSKTTINKPVQWYLFDPVQHFALKGLEVDPAPFYGGRRGHGRDVYMQLLKTCRDYIHSKYPTLVKWDRYHTGGRDIWVVDEVDRLSPQMDRLWTSVYNGMKLTSMKYLSNPILGLNPSGTHEMRRLYVCYSFEKFARGMMKEIAYAQYVLQHVSIQTSVLYTTVDFVMGLDQNPIMDVKALDEYIKTLKRKRRALTSSTNQNAAKSKKPRLSEIKKEP